jgi:hypothetical protein
MAEMGQPERIRISRKGYEELRAESLSRTIAYMRERIPPILAEARTRGCCFYRDRIGRRADGFPVVMQFSDGRGLKYRKQISPAKKFEETGIEFLLDDAMEVKAFVTSYVLNAEGMECARSRC